MKSLVAEVMAAKGVTIRALEQTSGITTVTILRARKDDMICRCSLGTLWKLADALGVQVSDLFSQDRDNDGE